MLMRSFVLTRWTLYLITHLIRLKHVLHTVYSYVMKYHVWPRLLDFIHFRQFPVEPSPKSKLASSPVDCSTLVLVLIALTIKRRWRLACSSPTWAKLLYNTTTQQSCGIFRFRGGVHKIHNFAILLQKRKLCVWKSIACRWCIELNAASCWRYHVKLYVRWWNLSWSTHIVGVSSVNPLPS